MIKNTSSTIVKFHEVPQGGLDFEFSQKSGELNQVLFDILGDYPVYHAILHITPMNAMVKLKGEIKGELRNICSRCAEDFSQSYSKNFLTAFYKSDEGIKNFSGAINDLEGSFDLEFLEGSEIDLAEVIHEQVAIEIPFKPLCSENCKGLCVKCGTNLNTSTCNCTINIEKANSPFEKLKSLRGD